MGINHQCTQRKYICIGENEKSLKFDNGEEITPCTKHIYLGVEIDKFGNNTTELHKLEKQ